MCKDYQFFLFIPYITIVSKQTAAMLQDWPAASSLPFKDSFINHCITHSCKISSEALLFVHSVGFTHQSRKYSDIESSSSGHLFSKMLLHFMPELLILLCCSSGYCSHQRNKTLLCLHPVTSRRNLSLFKLLKIQ